ncbi:MAG: flagellar biosynthetic protein FliO [Desulfovibrionaceae bacterium CG1_02_65_16]|nr:MAG: flagellar biosynthetic protein FliO [Desulfovibrionaceae bacterium CG1_02_65_16]
MPDQLFFDIVKMVVALACIVGLIFGVVLVLKRVMPGAARSAADRVDLQILGQLSLGSRQRVCVLRVLDRTLLVGITEGSINTLAELSSQSPAQKEADDPKIFADLLSWRKDGPQPAEPASLDLGGRNGAKQHADFDDSDDDPGEGPLLFAPGERHPR